MSGRWKFLPEITETAGEVRTMGQLKAVLFDFGGVLAEEGFREGLYAIARSQGLDPLTVHRAGMDAVYKTGYVLGQGSETDFWQAMRERCGIKGEDEALSREILDRFVLRPAMIEAVRTLRQRGVTVAILSDQTDWLERLDRRGGFMASFDRVFNSYRLGKGKRDPTIFDDVANSLGLEPGEALFVDDMPENVARAATRGLRTIIFRDEASFLAELARIGFETPI
jgi:putative hydrolase of the HAD superfamily